MCTQKYSQLLSCGNDQWMPELRKVKGALYVSQTLLPIHHQTSWLVHSLSCRRHNSGLSQCTSETGGQKLIKSTQNSQRFTFQQGIKVTSLETFSLSCHSLSDMKGLCWKAVTLILRSRRQEWRNSYIVLSHCRLNKLKAFLWSFNSC